jgi:hypothetical protein
VSSIAELERAAAFDPSPHFGGAASVQPPQNDVAPEQDEKPTLPPVAILPAQSVGEMRDSVSGIAPIGLFSSSPPHLRYSAPGPTETTNAGAPKPTPLAAFSEPPRVVSMEARAGSNPPPAPRDSSPSFAPVTQLSTGATSTQTDIARLKRRPVPWPLLALPLAAAVCLLAFFGVRVLLGPDESKDIVAALPTQPVTPAKVAAPSANAADEREQDEPSQNSAPSAPGAALAMRPYITASELEAEAADESPEREVHDGTRGSHRGRRAAQAAARRNNAAAAAPVTPPSNAQAKHERPSQALVDEHVDAPAPAPVAVVDAARPKLDEHEATASVVIAPPEPVSPAPAALKVEKPSVQLPLAAKVKIDAIEVRGSLPKSQVRHAAERLGAQFKACYAQAAQAAGHNGFGELIVTVEIDERGRARSPRVQGAGLPHLDGCVTETVQHLITSRVPDTGIVTATWKIVFMP